MPRPDRYTQHRRGATRRARHITSAKFRIQLAHLARHLARTRSWTRVPRPRPRRRHRRPRHLQRPHPRDRHPVLPPTHQQSNHPPQEDHLNDHPGAKFRDDRWGQLSIPPKRGGLRYAASALLASAAASVQDTVGGRAVVEQVAGRHPQVAVAWVDSGYKQSVIDTGAAFGIEVQVVTKDPQQRGFVPQRKRWAVERTFGWLMLHRRLVRDYETNPQRSRAMIHWAMIDNMTRRLTGESTLSWRDDIPKDPDITRHE